MCFVTALYAATYPQGSEADRYESVSSKHETLMADIMTAWKHRCLHLLVYQQSEITGLGDGTLQINNMFYVAVSV